MKNLIYLFLFLYTTLLCAFDDTSIDADIANAQSVDELVAKMQQAPKEFRHRYIDAITEKTSMHNQQKRELLAQEMIDQINAQKAQEGGLTGNSNGNSGGGAGSGSGSGKGGGGSGSGSGGGKGGGRGGGK